MPNIRPLSELRNNFTEISKYVHDTHEPVFLTKNGHGDMAVMSMETYERLITRFELHEKLDEGLAAIEQGDVISADAAFSALKSNTRIANE